jgi:hypothetical protein
MHTHTHTSCLKEPGLHSLLEEEEEDTNTCTPTHTHTPAASKSPVFTLFWWRRRTHTHAHTHTPAASKSPVFTLFSQTLDGLSTIRPLRLEGVLEAAVIRDIDANTAAYLAWAHVNRWLGVYICT